MTVHRGRIKEGTMCSLDFRYFYWPNIPETHRRTEFNANMLFHIQRHGNLIECWADGYGGGVSGRAGNYGNGSIFISRGRS